MKLKRAIIMPVALLIYLAAIAIYAWPGRNPGSISYANYWAIIGVTLACIVALTYLLRKRDKIREENRKDKKG